MKFTSLLATTAIASMVAASTVPVQAFNPSAVQASPQQVKIAQAPTSQEKISQDKIDQITPLKGKGGSGDLLRKLYAKDLTPIGVQVGGAGMVVNLYSKKDDTTISLCTTYDVVVAIKKGLIVQFDPSEVK
jgi:hypothetical protein